MFIILSKNQVVETVVVSVLKISRLRSRY